MNEELVRLPIAVERMRVKRELVLAKVVDQAGEYEI
jgi:hypothetical protein